MLSCVEANKAGQLITTLLLVKCDLLCFSAHQQVGVQALGAQALHQSANPEAISLAAEAQPGAPFSKTSTWTGLVDLDNAGVHSITKINSSSEITDEPVVINFKPEESWDENEDGPRTSQPNREEEEESHGPKSSNTSAFSDLRGLESFGGSAHIQEDGSYFGSSDAPALSPVASSTPQPQTYTDSVLAEFVKSLMRPFRYWTGGEEVKGTQKGPSTVEEKAGEDHAQGESTSRNLSIPKPSGNKGSMENAIIEHRSGSVSFWAPTTGAQSPDEGLLKQEKEVMPLIQLVPGVPKPGPGDTMMPAEQASQPPSTANGMSSCQCVPVSN